MNLLAFETSLGQCSVALYSSKTNKIMFYKKIMKNHMQAEFLVSLINESLEKNQMQYEDLNYVACTKGPGSFTGIRVSTSCICAIKIATNAIPITFSTFQMYKFRAEPQVKNIANILIIISAYTNSYYIQNFDLKDPKNDSDPQMISLENLSKYLEKSKKEMVCSGNVCSDVNLMGFLEKEKITYLPRSACAKNLIQMAIKSIKSNEFDSSTIPLYINPPSVNI